MTDYFGGPGIPPDAAPAQPGVPKPATVTYAGGVQGYDFNDPNAQVWRDYEMDLRKWQQAQDAYKRGYFYNSGNYYDAVQLKWNNDYVSKGGASVLGVTTSSNPGGSGSTSGSGSSGGGGSAGGGTGGSTGSGGTGGTGGTGSGGSGAGGGTPGLEGLDKYDRDAAEAIVNLFKTYGLDSLAPLVVQMIQRGMGEAAIVASLRDTQEYKTRFPGMEALRKQGYNAISESQYLQLEDSYHQALQSAGLPKGFYDDPKDFVSFLSNGVDPGELKQRAVAAVDLANQVDPAQRELLASMYGVSTTDLAAYFLDPKRAMPILQKQLGTVQIANAAQKAGIQADFANRSRFERLADNGIGAEQAAQGYAQIASEIDPLKNLASIWGQGSWSLDEAENATFFGNAQANKKRQKLVGQERAAFSGASGFDSRVSGRGATAGSF